MLVLVWVVLVVGVCPLAGPPGAQGSLHCAERRDISPCTCRPMQPATRTIDVMCERMTSFGQVLSALRERFQPDVQISLKVSYSQLDDLPERGFHELGIGVSKLTLKDNKLSQLPESAFSGLRGTQYLNLADNVLQEIPTGVLALMPKVRTLDLSRSRLSTVRTEDFQGLPALEHLVLAGNQLNTLHKDSLPRTLRHLHLGRNQLRHLNGTLRELLDLEWLFLNVNQFKSLDEQLPVSGMEKLALVFVSNNQLERLPQELSGCPRLEVMLASHNDIVSLDGVFARSRKLKRLEIEHNKIQRLAEDDFAEAENMEELLLGHNHIYSLNSSLQPVRALSALNMTHNLLEEFSMLEIRGLQNLKTVDLSYNRIVKLVGRLENVVDETRVEELRLDHNSLTSLDGALAGLRGLERLNLSHNKLERVSADDLVGLNQLKVLDVSHNRLHTMDDTSKTFMPALEELLASHNKLESLERDFHGLPALCKADLSNNNISHVHPQLTAHTRCKVHGVSTVLRISLHDNPIHCDEQLARTLLVFQSNLTELQGVPPCALALPPMLLTPGLALAGALPGALAASIPLIPGLTPVYAGTGQSPTIMVPVAFPLPPIEPITTTSTTTTTTTPEPPPTVAVTTPTPTSSPTPVESTTDSSVLSEQTTSFVESTTFAAPTVSSSLTETPINLPSSTSTTTTTTPVPAPAPAPAPTPPVLKELPPFFQLLQPEVSVQPSKDLPSLTDPVLVVFAAGPPPPPPTVLTPLPATSPAGPVDASLAPEQLDALSLPAPVPPSTTQTTSNASVILSDSHPAMEPVADGVPEPQPNPPLQPPEVPELPPLIQLLNQTALSP